MQLKQNENNNHHIFAITFFGDTIYQRRLTNSSLLTSPTHPNAVKTLHFCLVFRNSELPRFVTEDNIRRYCDAQLKETIASKIDAALFFQRDGVLQICCFLKILVRAIVVSTEATKIDNFSSKNKRDMSLRYSLSSGLKKM